MEQGQRPCFLHSDKYRRVAMAPQVHLTKESSFCGSNYPPKLPLLCLAQMKKKKQKILESCQMPALSIIPLNSHVNPRASYSSGYRWGSCGLNN